MEFSIRNAMLRNRLRVNQSTETDNQKADRAFLKSREKEMKIKIIKCSNPEYWYNAHVGELYEVSYVEKLWDGDNYRLKGAGYVLKGDIEEIKETKMKVVEKSVEHKTIYPCLKTTRTSYNGKIIVLFSMPGKGICLLSQGGDGVSVGGYSETWNESAFELYKGTLEISNGD